MKISFPLSLKVTLWLLLNLLLLAAVGLGFFFAQAGLRWDSMVSGPAGERVQMLANVIAGELSATPSSAHDTVLARFSAAYQVEFFLFRNNGEQLAGNPIALPAEVRERIRSRRPPREDGPPDGNRPPPDDPLGLGPPRGHGRPPAEAPPPRAAPGRGRFLLRAGEPTQYWIGLRMALEEGPDTLPTPVTLIAVAPTLGATVRFLEWRPWLIAGAAVLGFSVLFWLPLVRSITRALGHLTAATERIAEGRFDTRVDATRRDELGRLGHAVNQMAARLDTFVSGQKRFLGDVAHELCSPLARLQMAVGILEERDDPGLKQAVADVREEVQQMSALVNELLAFSKAGLRAREIALGPVELAPLVARVLARENAGRVAVRLMPGLVARAEPGLLERALGNLVRNALRYGGAGPIHLSGHTEGNGVVLSLFDEGPGVPPESLARLGEPFFRPEAARTREGGGVGLGLAIVKSSIETCGGRLVLRNRAPHGFLAELHLLHAAPPV
jgi:two-component system sensor histidine kinase CpxA